MKNLSGDLNSMGLITLLTKCQLTRACNERKVRFFVEKIEFRKSGQGLS